MKKQIEDSGVFTGGYFVINKESEIDYLIEYNEKFPITWKTNRTLLSSIVRMISEAENYLKICSFIVDNEKVIDALIEKLKEGSTSVFILTAVDEKNLKSDLLDEDEYNQISKSRHFEFIDNLVKYGAHIRASSNAHAKFLVKDGNSALIMSANLTEPSLTNNEKGKDPNSESGVYFDNRSDIITLERVFDSIFLYGTEFKRFINLSDNTQLISEKEIEICETDFPIPNSRIIWSYENMHWFVYKTLISFLEMAKSTVLLSTYSIVELEKLSELTHIIRTFIFERGGNLSVFCRAMNHRADHLYACKQLAEMGVRIYGDMFNHSKGISIDEEYGALFTANIDGKHGLKSGFEVGYIFHQEDEVFKSFNSFLNQQIKTAPYKFKISPHKRELFEFYHDWYNEKNIKVPTILPDVLEIKYRLNSSYSGEFEESIVNYPIFYTVLRKSESNEIQFLINGKAYLLEILNKNTLSLKKQLRRDEVTNAERYLLFYKVINVNGYESN